VNDQRDRAIARLSEHFAADQITVDELERRLDLVYQAKSAAELASLTADLPAPLVAPTSARTASAAVAGSSMSRAPAGGAIRRIRTFLGNIERSGAIDVPAYLEVRSVLGNIELDFRDATFGPYTEIAVRAVLGNVEITLPEGVRVENDGDGVLGSFECHTTPGARPLTGTAPVVRLTGRTILGNVEVHADPPDPLNVAADANVALPR
jgi:hypothetical protein